MKIISINGIVQEQLKDFSCGNKDLDNFLKKFALRNDQNGYGKTFILEDKNEIIGFFTLCSSSIRFEELPLKQSVSLPKYPVPCIRIARLAVNKIYQGKGYGRELLKQAFLRILSASSTIGIRLIVVDAKETSASFYEKYGFERLNSNGMTYYLLLDTLISAINN